MYLPTPNRFTYVLTKKHLVQQLNHSWHSSGGLERGARRWRSSGVLGRGARRGFVSKLVAGALASVASI